MNKNFNLSIFSSRKTRFPAMEQSLNNKFIRLSILKLLKIYFKTLNHVGKCNVIECFLKAT